MRPWIMNVLIGTFTVLAILFLPRQSSRMIFLLAAGISGMWAYKDSLKIHTERHKKVWFCPGSPRLIAFAVWAFWPIMFPCYITYRQMIKERKIPLK